MHISSNMADPLYKWSALIPTRLPASKARPNTIQKIETGISTTLNTANTRTVFSTESHVSLGKIPAASSKVLGFRKAETNNSGVRICG